MISATPSGSTKVHGSLPTTLAEFLKTGCNRQSFIEDQIREAAAASMGIPISAVDARDKLDSLGFDSARIDTFIGELETVFSIPLRSPNRYSQITIEQLARLIADRISDQGKSEDLGSEDIVEQSPLTYGQRALWFLQQLDSSSIAYNVSYAMRVPAALDMSVTERAFQRMVDRQPCLRSTFGAIDREPVRQIHAHVRVAFVVEDGSEWSPQQWRDRYDEEMFRPFDLTTGPLMRAFIFRKSDEDYVVMVNTHHIIADMWSYAVMMSEFAQFYQAELTGEEATLPPLNTEYADHVRTEAAMLEGPEGERHWEYWRSLLHDFPTRLLLPTDHPRTNHLTNRGSALLEVLDSDLTVRLRAHARSLNCSLFTVLLGAFQALLYHCTGEEKLLIGTPKACRSSKTGRLVGYFVNTNVLPGDMTGGPAWRAFLSQLHKTVKDSSEHDAFPFPLLVERLQPERELTRTPLFQVLFSWQKTVSLVERKKMEAFALGAEGQRTKVMGLPMEPVCLPSRVVPFDLSLLVGESGDGIALTLEYSNDLFEQTTIAKFLERYVNILQAVIENPDQLIDDLPVLTETEKQALTSGGLRESLPTDSSVVRTIEEQAAVNPVSTALASGHTIITYEDLESRANQLARYLRRRRVRPEVIVATMLPRSIDAIIALLGILKAGGIYLPIDPDCPPDRRDLILGDASPGLVITTSTILGSRALPSDEVLCLDKEQAGIDLESEQKIEGEIDPRQGAYIIYTSGSTGLPKGVLITHDTLARHCRVMREHYETTAKDVVLQFASLEFDASLEQILVPLIAGAKIVLRDPELWTPEELFRRIAAESMTIINIPPAYWNQIVLWSSTTAKASVPGSLRLIIVGGDVLTPESIRTWWKTCGNAVRLLNAYGPTETTITATAHEVAPDEVRGDGTTRVPIGRPLGNRSAYILNRSMRPVPAGAPGELFLGGDGLARGYLHKADRTAEKFLPDPFAKVRGARMYRTGDWCRQLPDGAIEYIGRTDFQIKVRGFRVEIGEIESALLRHPAISHAVVMPREDGIGERRLVAYLVARPALNLDVDEIRRFLQKGLPPWMLPSAYMPLERIPLSAGGKVDRGALPIPDWRERSGRQAYTAPRTPVEGELAAMLAGVLGAERVGIHDNFFDLGGHSLLATQFIALVRDRYKVDIPLRTVFESPTVADLAAMLPQTLAAEEDANEMALLIAEVEHMSDEAVKTLLRKEQLTRKD